MNFEKIIATSEDPGRDKVNGACSMIVSGRKDSTDIIEGHFGTTLADSGLIEVPIAAADRTRDICFRTKKERQ
jgi:hypothetical protein